MTNTSYTREEEKRALDFVQLILQMTEADREKLYWMMRGMALVKGK